MRLEHVNLTVSDLERSLAFYREALGFEVRWQGKILSASEVKPGAHVGPADSDFYLALFEGERDDAAKSDYGAPGLNHFGLVVEDLPAAKASAEAAGAKFHFEADYEPGHRAYFFDPDGIEIELVSY